MGLDVAQSPLCLSAKAGFGPPNDKGSFHTYTALDQLQPCAPDGPPGGGSLVLIRIYWGTLCCARAFPTRCPEHGKSGSDICLGNLTRPKNGCLGRNIIPNIMWGKTTLSERCSSPRWNWNPTQTDRVACTTSAGDQRFQLQRLAIVSRQSVQSGSKLHGIGRRMGLYQLVLKQESTESKFFRLAGI